MEEKQYPPDVKYAPVPTAPPVYQGQPQQQQGGPPPGGAYYAPVNQGQGGQQLPQVIVVAAPQQPSYVKHIILSCITFWCCCWCFGLIAFILACKLNKCRRIQQGTGSIVILYIFYLQKPKTYSVIISGYSKRLEII